VGGEIAGRVASDRDGRRWVGDPDRPVPIERGVERARPSIDIAAQLGDARR